MVDLTDSLKSALLHAKELSDNEVANLRDSLCGKTIKELRAVAKSVCVRLTGSSRKTDMLNKNSLGAVKKGHSQVK